MFVLPKEYQDIIKERYLYYRNQDMHINDNDSRNMIRHKDMNFGSYMMLENMMEMFNISKEE